MKQIKAVRLTQRVLYVASSFFKHKRPQRSSLKIKRKHKKALVLMLLRNSRHILHINKGVDFGIYPPTRRLFLIVCAIAERVIIKISVMWQGLCFMSAQGFNEPV
jgi:hypothetical protein